MVWTRFVEHAAVLNFYRNPLKVSYPLQWGARNGTLYVFDEGTYSFNQSSWTRNRLAVGIEYHVLQGFAMDVYYARQRDRFIEKLNLFIITATFQFQSKKKSTSAPTRGL